MALGGKTRGNLRGAAGLDDHLGGDRPGRRFYVPQRNPNYGLFYASGTPSLFRSTSQQLRFDLIPSLGTKLSMISDEGMGNRHVQEQAHGSGDDWGAETARSGGCALFMSFTCRSSHRSNE